MRNKKRFSIIQEEAPVTFMEATIRKIEIQYEDIDTIKIKVEFTNGRFISKKFKKYSFEYLKAWKNKKKGDNVILKIQAGIIKGISLISY